MPTLALKKLYFAESVEELQKKANVNKATLSDKQTSKLIKTADKILKEAKKYHENKDEEMAYIYYFKFIDLIIILSERTDVSMEPLWQPLKKFANEAMDIAKTLKSSLIKRYSDKYQIRNRPVVSPKLTVTTNEHEKNKTNYNSLDEITTNDIKPKVSDSEKLFADDAITASELFDFMCERKFSFVIMDVRSSKDFDESHIKHSSCINIPSEILLPGITSTSLEQNLPRSSQAKWLERGIVDYVILIDWDTATIPLSQKNSLLSLQDAITKWDLRTPLKRTPCILKGGYKEWVLRYPMHCTKALDILSLEKNTTCLITDVSDIDYPDFDDTDLVMDKNRKNVTPQINSIPRPLFSRETKPREQMNNVFTKITNLDTSIVADRPNSNVDISSIQTFQPASINSHIKENIKPIPDFDRSLKPIKNINRTSFGQSETLFQSPQIASKIIKDDEKFLNELKNEEAKIDLKKDESLPNTVKPLNIDSSIKPTLPEKTREDGNGLNNESKPYTPEKVHAQKHNDHLELGKTFSETVPKKENHKSDEYFIPLKEEGGSRGLTRSYSSPNIAELIPTINETKRSLPTVDRSTKPKMDRIYSPVNDSHMIVRNLNPIYGHCLGRPVTGLKNLGNTCYMNAIIQCLSNTDQLSHYFISDQYRQHLRRNKPGSYCEVTEEFAVVVRALWMGTYKSIAPRDLKNCLAKYIPMCAGNEQQDSHEFLMLLFDKIHNELNQGREADPLPDLDSLPVSIATEKFWNHYRIQNKSKVSELFEGLLKSTLKCSSCETTSTSYEVFSCLSLPISEKRSVKDCLECFLKSEKMFGDGAWLCPGCKQKKVAEKILTISKFPSVLIIQLKRFSYIGMWKEKLQASIKYQSTLDVQGKIYDLYGIVNHVGCLEGGHYTACCKHPSSSDWFKYDDHEASKISFNEIPTSAAYMLFYTSRDMKNR